MSTFVTEINKLKNVQQNLEKNENILIEQLNRIDCKTQLSEFYADITNNRKAQKEKLERDVKDIVMPLHKVKDLLRNDIENIDLNVMKRDMTKIQKNIQNLQNYTKTSLESLQKEEDKLFEDVQQFEKKIQEWSKPAESNVRKRTATKRVSTSTAASVSQEVTEFSEYVNAHGGHENGWTVEDHGLFLRARMKTKNVQHLAEILHAMLPDISEEEVILHENWYKKYLELKEKQKAALKNWREKKLKPQQPAVRSKPKTSVMQAPVSHIEVVQKEETQYKLSAWKAEKRAQMKNDHLQKQQEILKKKEQERQEKLRQKQIKKEVTQWKYVKAQAEEAEKLQKETAEQRERDNRAAKANKLIKEFQKQDHNFLQRKLQTRLNQPKGLDVLKVNQVEAPRDPQRLLKPTKQWILRTYGSDESGTANSKLSLQAIPKLGIPEWRKSIV